MANPVFVYTAAYSSAGSATQSAFVTASFANTAGFEAWIPIKVLSPATANISAGAIVYVMRSTDGGNTYESLTEATVGAAFSLPGSGGIQTKDLMLRDPGQYLISVMVGGGSATAWSVQFGSTAQIITAYA